MGNFKEDIAGVEAFVFDVDGVFTDGGITPIPGDDFIRRYYAKDGYAVAYAMRMGYRICIISGGRGELLRMRMKKLKVTKIYLDCMDKIAAMNEFFEEYGINPKRAVFMGDDIPDLECMRAVGIPVCPADAASEVIEASRYVSEYPGGRGCVRDIIEQALRADGKWALDSRGVNGSKDAASR
ncbi:MAG: HAD hydrolase family protein [Alistipes sp.]|nr:HAD hydrolase family protein [Alistipes sp.]